MGEASEDNLIEQLRLILDRPRDLRAAMAMGDHPPGRDGVEKARAVLRLQPAALGASDFYRAGLQGVLRVRAPDGRVRDESHGLVLNEIRDGESLGEGAPQSLGIQRGKVRQATEHGDAPHARDRVLRVFIRLADKGDPAQRNVATPQRL